MRCSSTGSRRTTSAARHAAVHSSTLHQFGVRGRLFEAIKTSYSQSRVIWLAESPAARGSVASECAYFARRAARSCAQSTRPRLSTASATRFPRAPTPTAVVLRRRLPPAVREMRTNKNEENFGTSVVAMALPARVWRLHAGPPGEATGSCVAWQGGAQARAVAGRGEGIARDATCAKRSSRPLLPRGSAAGSRRACGGARGAGGAGRDVPPGCVRVVGRRAPAREQEAGARL